MDPRQIRPRRRWYGVAVAIAVLFTAIGVGGFVAGIVTATNSVPDFDHTYTGNQESQVQLEAGRKYALYVPENSSRSCTVDERVTTRNPNATFSFTRDGQQWVHLTNLSAGAPGAYSINCSVPTYAVGAEPELGQLAGGIGGGIAALLGLPCIGITIGGIIALVTGLRRSSHKKRLQAAQYTY
jgi:hypothetical protein